MLSFKDLQEVLQPRAAGEKRFKDKHVVDTIDYPLNDAEINKGTKKSPAKKKRIADNEEGKDAAVYEENEEMTPEQKKKREEIVMAMKKDKEKLQARYGESWKAVMYATATKQAMSEEVKLDEAQKMFMFKTKAEAEKKAKQIKGVMTQLGPKNFMVVTKDLTKVPSKAKMKFGKDKDVTPKGYGPDEELDESAAGIAQLKKAYEPFRGKKLSLANAKKISALMDKFAVDKALLIKLVKADIPFVTQSAVTKLITKHGMKGAEINKMMREELDEKAPKMKTTDIMRDRGKKAGPQTYQVDIEGAGRATVKAANEKMAIQKAMTQMKINKKIKPLPKATVKVMEQLAKIKGNTPADDGRRAATQDDIDRAEKKGDKKLVKKLKEEADLDEAFKINATNQKLNDGSMVKITKADASALNSLYNSLNPANAKTMIKKMMQDKKSYGEILAFANQAM